mgnify:CR=1 FL=1|jgi:hypothetical protein
MGQSEIPEKWRAQALSEVRVSEAGVSMMIWFDSWLEAKTPVKVLKGRPIPSRAVIIASKISVTSKTMPRRVGLNVPRQRASMSVTDRKMASTST